MHNLPPMSKDVELLEGSDHFCGNAGSHRPGRNIARDYAAGANDAARANGYAAQYNHARAQPDILFEDNRSRWRAFVAPLRLQPMKVVIHHDHICADIAV